uniref:Uncharacterized protein n=1 Tax=Arundo donax TaxID=35708 RepID=A0A0A9GBU6_ARUDO
MTFHSFLFFIRSDATKTRITVCEGAIYAESLF